MKIFMVLQGMKALLITIFLSSIVFAKNLSYEPCKLDEDVVIENVSFEYEKRKVPLKIYFPLNEDPAPVILLSHGLGGSREFGAYLGKRWANAGYVVVAMQHQGSDENLWRGKINAEAMKSIKKGVNTESFLARVRDVSATIDQLEKWNVMSGHSLEKRLNLESIGIAGHSFGARTTQAVTGQSAGRLGPLHLDERIDAGMAMSPNIPQGTDPKKAFSTINVPMLLMTGTKDQNFFTKAPPEERREVFKALEPLDEKFQTRHYELVLKDAEHGAFSDRAVVREKKKNPNHHKVIQTLSIAFWDSSLKEKSEASEWLNSKKPYQILEDGDLWSKK